MSELSGAAELRPVSEANELERFVMPVIRHASILLE